MQEPCTPQTVPLNAGLDFASSSSVSAAEWIDAACQMIATGRIVANQLAVHAKSFGLTEAEFRLLWLLRTICDQQSASRPPQLLNQKAMCERLGLSPAQISAVVERLRKEGLIVGQASATDRRQNVWQLTSSGQTLLETIVTKLASQPSAGQIPHSACKEDAA
ncbi:MAG: MarR family transcriptional regulator [Planctomycetes bacterium]|nr:MarR family transcriptional regulator [Planctomycetota bacterium]